MEHPIIAGIAHDRSQGKFTVVGLPDTPGIAASLFETVAGAGANLEMIVQNVSTDGSGRTDISFTLPKSDCEAVRSALEDAAEELQYSEVIWDDQIGKLSLVGAGMRTEPGISAKLFKAVVDAGVNIEMISTSEIRCSVVVREESLDTAVRAAHTAFGLDSAEPEAVVYGGTGR